MKIRENIIQSPPSALLQIIRPAPRIMHHTSDEDSSDLTLMLERIQLDNQPNYGEEKKE